MSQVGRYSAKNFKSLGDYEHLVKRLSLILGKLEEEGEPFSRQKTVAVREIQDNSFDELRAGHGDRIRANFYKDGSVVIQDNAWGLPVDTSIDTVTQQEASGIFLTMGRMRSGGKFSTKEGGYTSGLNGLGGSAAIAVCRCAIIDVFVNNKQYSLHFKDWKPGFFADPTDPNSQFTPVKNLTDLLIVDDTRDESEKALFPTGTRTRLWFNDDVFSSKKPYDSRELIRRLRDTAYLVPGIYVDVYDEQQPTVNPDTGEAIPFEASYHFDNGLEDLLNIRQPDEPITKPVILEGVATYQENVMIMDEDNGSMTQQRITRKAPIRLAFSYGNKYDYTLSSYVNTIHTKFNGVHVSGFESAFVRAFNNRLPTLKGALKKDEALPNIKDYREGLTVILAVEISEPSFDGQAKDSISGEEVHKAIREEVLRMLNTWIGSNRETVSLIATKVVQASRARTKQENERAIKRKNNEVKRNTVMPEKLVDCRQAGCEGAELYLVEGDSAATSMKNARNSDIHAILPFRGVSLNAEKATKEKLLANEEIVNLAKTLGVPIGEDFDPNDARYDRIFLSTDADVDGAHIRVLLLYIFWVCFRPILEAGMVYSIRTPLYSLETTTRGRKKEFHYALNDRERNEVVGKLVAQGHTFKEKRLKGLGEVPAEVLEWSAYDVNHRVVNQIIVTEDDIPNIMKHLQKFNGKDNADERRKWIIENSEDYYAEE